MDTCRVAPVQDDILAVAFAGRSDMLGASRVDRLDDLYPGSGAIRRAWIRYTGNESSVTIAGSDAKSEVA